MDKNLYEWIGNHVAFQMTPRLPDLDNSQTFYARYRKPSLRVKGLV